MAVSSTVEKINKLTLSFANAVGAAQADKTANTIVSPYNAVTALSIVAAGAAGETREQLARSLFNVPTQELEQQIEDLNALSQEILEANKGDVTLKMANALWTNAATTQLDESFAAMIADKYGAEISAADFGNADTVARINAWAAKNTEGALNEVLTKLEPQDRAVLSSVLYFKGAWSQPFDKNKTTDAVFTTDDGTQYTTPMMHGSFKYGDKVYHKTGRDYKAAGMTYGADRSMWLVLIRPDDASVTARDWLAQQTDTDEWLNAFKREETTNIYLPRMDITQTHDLIPSLKSLGIKDAFDAKAANFAKMIPANDVFISSVKQNVSFRTDEEGSVAAAATTVTFTNKGINFNQFNIHFDRSYVMALMDGKTDAVLFLGTVNKPSAEMKRNAPGF